VVSFWYLVLRPSGVADVFFLAIVASIVLVRPFKYIYTSPVKGVDVLFIGSGDLSQSMGYPGQQAHPEVQAVMEMEAVEGAVRGASEDLISQLGH